MTVDIRECARCGDDHRQLVFKRMARPVDDVWAFWAACPTTGDPILLKVETVDS